MKKLNECLAASKVLSGEIKRTFREMGYKDEEDFYDIDTHAFTPDESLMYNELRKAFAKLEDFNYILEYLNSPIQFTGTLRENENGRFELENGYEFTSGSRIEALVYFDFDDTEAWVRTSVESNEKGYYLVGYNNIPLAGLKVRVRA
ncbi:hypothetical protein A5819_003545 [Enterococcus sp. 7E2_DIV0204]|uniref:DUF5348 domain-containing protein n=1 Tax=unclassified Enterococcus TaxID=2608891 RepID=UPI000A34562F|nr:MULTISPECIES: DUF5348 domain-containing protein [unclassified Enterococcus]OTN83995.1 hypothetical protein A5819_003545 [Enterococcus sp. 7E2_DIV0204]OTP47222.1 hypothetical protein A5884_003597 [Enterococcus sp. 7D2_DIV0200]